MQRPRTEAELVAWKAGDAERNERARIERLRSDGARSPCENLVEAVMPARAAQAASALHSVSGHELAA